MELKNISENNANKTLVSKLIVGLGIEHVVDNSYIVLATFKSNNGKKMYYASGENVKSVYDKASKYFDNPAFEGVIYHINGAWGIPISNEQILNIKHWN